MNVQEVTKLARDIRVATLKSLTDLGFTTTAAVCRSWKRWRYCTAR